MSGDFDPTGFWQNLGLNFGLDRDHDGDVDRQDIRIITGMILDWISDFIQTLLKGGVKPLIAAMTEAVVAVGEMDGDKREAALDRVVQKLADAELNVLLDTGMSKSAALGERFGIDPESVYLILGSTVKTLKSRGVIR